MDENNTKYDSFKDLMENVDKAMKDSNKRDKAIEKLKKSALKETAPLKVEEMQKEIAEKEDLKNELDEMTAEYIPELAQKLKEANEQIEKDLNDRLMEIENKNATINKRLEAYKSKDDVDPAKLEQAKASAEKALAEGEEKRKKLFDEIAEKREYLDKSNEKIREYADTLGVTAELDRVMAEGFYFDDPEDELINEEVKDVEEAEEPKVEEEKNEEVKDEEIKEEAIAEEIKTEEAKIEEVKNTVLKDNLQKTTQPIATVQKEIETKTENEKAEKSKIIKVDYFGRMNMYRLKDDIGEEHYGPNQLKSIYDPEKEKFLDGVKQEAERIYGKLPNLDYKLMEVLYESGENAVYEYIESFANEKSSNHLKINYDLKGIFDKKHGYSKEEIRQMLDIANTASKNKIATVNKGFKVSFLEFFDNIARKFENIKLLPEKTSSQKVVKEEKVEVQNSEKENVLDNDKDIRKTMRVDDIANDLEGQKSFSKDAQDRIQNIQNEIDLSDKLK